MKILIVNKFDNHGGAAIAAWRQYEALKTLHSDIRFFSQQGNNGDYIWSNTKIKKFISSSAFALGRLYDYIHLKNKHDKFHFDSAKIGINPLSHRAFEWADLIHIHWLNFSFFSLKTLQKLFELGKPVVWTLHDQWAMTGGCFYPMGCQKYKEQCNNCPLLLNNQALKVYMQKQKIFRNATNLHFIAISSWIKNEIMNSPLLNRFQVALIPNPIDTNLFKPVNKQEFAKNLNLNPNIKRIGFVAFNIDDKRKGAHFLKQALKLIEDKFAPDELEILVIGKKTKNNIFTTKFPVIYTGYINNPSQMVKYYNLMDVFVIPSLQDNLPNTVMESLACGTPVVGFNIGGIPDMVQHKFNGYLAQPQNPTDLAEGIRYILTNQNHKQLRKNARDIIVHNFSYQIIGKKLLEFYTQILAKR